MVFRDEASRSDCIVGLTTTETDSKSHMLMAFTLNYINVRHVNLCKEEFMCNLKLLFFLLSFLVHI